MNETAAFSRDTGPGAPGKDNTHIPGRSYTTHQVEDTGCALCRTEVGYWEHDGTCLYGTEGQRRHYVWTLPPQEIPAKCTICDECLEPFIARGDLELYLDREMLVEGLSDTAIKVLFAEGARWVINSFAEFQQAPLQTSEFILPISAAEIDQIMGFAHMSFGLDDIMSAGKHYAHAALAFGKVLGDPAFEAAAEHYVDVWLHQVDPDIDPETMAEEELLRQMLEASGLEP